MDYGEYLDRAAADLGKMLQQRGYDVEVDRYFVEKLQGQSYEGLRVMRQGDMAGHIIDPKHFYQEIQDGRTYRSTIWEMADFSEAAMRAVPEIENLPFGDYETMKQHLIIEVVSRSENAEMLQNVPHTEMMDLAEVYRCVVPIGEGRSGSVLITNQMLEMMDLTKEQIRRDAHQYAPLNNPVSIMSLGAVMNGLIPGMEGPEDASFAAETPFFVAQGSQQSYGAGVICYPDFMENAAKQIGGNFYVLPSSVHEVLLLPETGTIRSQELLQMVTEINATVVSPEERLTDNVYHYDSVARVFETGRQYEDRCAGREAEKSKKPSVIASLNEKRQASQNHVSPGGRNDRGRSGVVL